MPARLTFIRLAIVLAAAAVLLLSTAVPALAVDGWKAEALAPSAGRQVVTGTDGDLCVYQEAAGDGPTQIYLANLATGQITRVTDTAYACRAARLDGGYVAYEGYVGAGNPEIFLYEIATGRTTRITANDYPDQAPDIGDGFVAWVGGVGPVHDGSDQEILFYDIASAKTTRVTSNGTVDCDPRVSGAHVAWRELVGDEMEVFAYDAVSGKTDRLSTDSTSNREVSVSGNLVAWIGNLPQMTGPLFVPQVYLYDLDTGQVKTLPGGLPPGVVQLLIDTAVLHDGLLAWTWESSGDDHLSVYDPATGKTTIFGGGELSPIKKIAVSGGLAVWEQSDWHDDEIMAGDLATGITSQLTTNGTNDWNPMTSNGRVVWQDYSQGRAQLMVASTGVKPSTPFVDVSGTTRSRSAVVELAEEGALTGYPTAQGAEFKPDAPLLRAQLAKMLVTALGIPVHEGMDCPFRDLGPNDPTTLYPNDYVAAAYQAGIIQGTTATTFTPWRAVTRGQAISLAVRYVLKQHPDSLPPPPAAEYQQQYDLSDEYPSVHDADIRVAFYNGLLGGVLTGDSGWNPWFEIKRAEVAQILVNARQHTAPAPKPTENFFLDLPVIKSLDDLNAYLAQEKALLTQLATQEPNEIALVHVSFKRPLSVSELARLEAGYALDPWSRDAIFEHAGMGAGPVSLSAGDWVRSMQAESFGSAIGPPGPADEGTAGELVGFTDIDVWAPLEALARLQREEAVVLVDPWKFFEQMRDDRRQGWEVTAGSYPSVYYAYQKYVVGQ